MYVLLFFDRTVSRLQSSVNLFQSVVCTQNIYTHTEGEFQYQTCDSVEVNCIQNMHLDFWPSELVQISNAAIILQKCNEGEREMAGLIPLAVART